ncbi:MAG TPA: hypothetical protein VFY59_17715, partial [Rubrobacter sp.]|nr:hypothetical protein [Rubrobacter sp.]
DATDPRLVRCARETGFEIYKRSRTLSMLSGTSLTIAPKPIGAMVRARLDGAPGYNRDRQVKDETGNARAAGGG